MEALTQVNDRAREKRYFAGTMAGTNNTQSHWETVFTSKDTREVSWFQPYPKKSVEILDRFHLLPDARIIDVGAGDSNLVDALLDKGFSQVYVLDISAAALEKARERLGARAAQVHWIVSDISTFVPPVQFDCWHDRAAFHFLTTDEKVEAYVKLAAANIRPGGYLVLGTFSKTGPTKCSGLEIRQYSAESLSARFEPYFDRLRCEDDRHETPSHQYQDFVFCAFRRK